MMNNKLSEPGKIITFYSYKGGAGRSMALANISCLLTTRLADSTKKILVIDWDLEAPGLHRYFSSQSNQNEILSFPGLMDFFYELNKILNEEPDLFNKMIESKNGMNVLDNAIPLNNYIIPGPLKGIDFIKAGKFDGNYPELVNSFNWVDFFNKYGAIFEVFKELISSRYAYCLVDSRTGLTDISGICSMIMPEKLVTVFTPNIQSMDGIIDLIRQSIEYRRSSNDFRPLAIFPLPSRIELAEKDLRNEWRLRYQNEFGKLFREVYELDKCDLSAYFDQIQLPHVSYYSYGEKIAALEEYSTDTLSLSNAYERFMNYLIDFDFAWQESDQTSIITSISKKIPLIKGTSPQEKEISLRKVFISSTFMDLQAYRRAAIEVVNRCELIPLAMEFLSSKPEEFTLVCDNEIRDCDLFIGIYAHRYGYIPNGETKSITHLEYDLAKELGKERLCFIVEKNFPWNPNFIEIEKYTELKAFLEEVKKECVVGYFKSPEDFIRNFSTSLGKLIAELSGNKDREAEGKSYIPRAPYPYMAHPYALPEHFTGRRAEIAMLSNWFFNEEYPVLVLEAIGGMGKSALSWAWLHQEIMERAVKVDGVFWWSFYDEPFESFITYLYCYVTGKDAAQGIDLGELLAFLGHHRFLLMLDGLERALRGYAGMEAMFIQEKKFAGDTHSEAEWDKRVREPVHPKTGRFLQALCAGNTRTLITTRLTPVSLEGIGGVKRVFLTGLSPEDTVSFFRSEGIIGTRAEMEQAGRVYDFHPLMLKLLASAIKRSRAKDIKEAFSLNIIAQKEPHKILDRSILLLSEEERQVATRIAVFRGGFTFDAAKALTMEMEEKRLWEVLQVLRNLGFLFYDESQDRFDFPPILRSLLYRQLTTTGGPGVHDLAAQYFRALPEPEKVVTLEDLSPVIELYHHMVKAGKFDEAFVLFRDRIANLLYNQLSAYHLQIELLKELFPQGDDDRLPLPKKETDQAWTLKSLANVYALSGQPAKAVPLFLKYINFSENNDDKTSLALGLGNTASMAQIYIGQFSAAADHLRKCAALCVEIKDEIWEAIWRRELGFVLAFQGRTTEGINLNPPLRGSACAEEELAIAFRLFERGNNVEWLSLVSAYLSLSALLKARLSEVLPVKKNRPLELSREALNHARQALKFAEETIKTEYPYPRDFVQAYWLLGEALIRYCMDRSTDAKLIEPFEFAIPFYDAYFQRVMKTETVTHSIASALNAASHCLHEALRRCRTINLLEFEPDILLALTRLDFAQNKPPDETILKEAFEIALRSGYRLKLADLHLFCGQVLLQFEDMKSLLGFTATEHLQKTKEYALDVSDISHLYSPVKSSMGDFYKDIPEYDMLKHGLTDEERIQNGYWVAYLIAENLLKEGHGRSRTEKDKRGID